jgi:TolB protein
MKRYVGWLVLLIVLLNLWGCFQINEKVSSAMKDYSNPEIKITLQYPSNWKPDEKIPFLGSQPSRYFGTDGFFAINVIDSEDTDLETIAKKEVETGDYGTEPQVKRMIHNARIGYLILPSSDQRADENRRSCFITDLRNIYRSNQINYDTFILFADQEHLMDLIDKLEN